MSSMDKCFVSGMEVLTKIKEQTHNAPKMKKVLDMPTMPSRIGNIKVTRKLVHHRQRTVRPIQVERILVGNISEIISQVAGETQDC